MSLVVPESWLSSGGGPAPRGLSRPYDCGSADMGLGELRGCVPSSGLPGGARRPPPEAPREGIAPLSLCAPGLPRPSRGPSRAPSSPPSTGSDMMPTGAAPSRCLRAPGRSDPGERAGGVARGGGDGAPALGDAERLVCSVAVSRGCAVPPCAFAAASTAPRSVTASSCSSSPSSAVPCESFLRLRARPKALLAMAARAAARSLSRRRPPLAPRPAPPPLLRLAAAARACRTSSAASWVPSLSDSFPPSPEDEGRWVMTAPADSRLLPPVRGPPCAPASPVAWAAGPPFWPRPAMVFAPVTGTPGRADDSRRCLRACAAADLRRTTRLDRASASSPASAQLGERSRSASAASGPPCCCAPVASHPLPARSLSLLAALRRPAPAGPGREPGLPGDAGASSAPSLRASLSTRRCQRRAAMASRCAASRRRSATRSSTSAARDSAIPSANTSSLTNGLYTKQRSAGE
mmetsp:Transcript_4658/g.19847  ORF Transcript_4658/g.19847 Transcript_4658/m.19847 type:complete len:464 (-) Transcript_4658:702-2093(-)